MNRIIPRLLLTISLLFSFFTGAFSVNDTIPTLPVQESWPETFQFSSGLDSLVNDWYVKKALANRHLDHSFTEVDSTAIPEFSDEVYMERLNRLPSPIALPYNEMVKAFIHVYTRQKRDKVEIMLGLTDYYFPMFEEVFDAYGLPVELKNLAIVESALNPRAVSKAGATGLWQFMFSTGKQYNLEITSFVDDRNDPLKATHAAARFLKDLHKMFGDWTLAIAAYNCGPGNVLKAIRRAGGKTNYWDIYYHLPLETRGYVPAFIAATYTMNYYREHKLKPVPLNFPIETDTVIIAEELHLEQVSSVLQIPMAQLRALNPQYKRDLILPKQKEYALTLPARYAPRFIQLQDSVFTYNDSVFFNPDDKVKGPSRYASKSSKAHSPEGRSKLYYTVKSGDNLGLVSSWYDVNISELKQWNKIKGNKLKEGQRLAVFVPKSRKNHYELINSMSFEEKQGSIGQSIASKTSASDQKFVQYTVRKGDTLFKISKKYPGVTNQEIMEANNITNARSLSVGQKLRIPKKK